MEKFKKIEGDGQFNIEFKKSALLELFDSLEKKYPGVKIPQGTITEDGKGGFMREGKPIDDKGINNYMSYLKLLNDLEKRYPDVKLMPGTITEDGQGGFLKDGKPIDYEGIKKFILSLRRLDEPSEKDKWYDK